MNEAYIYPDRFAQFLPYFEREYDFGFCPADRIGDVERFIDAYWKKGHALAVSRALMDWQHYDRERGQYLISVARHKKSGEIHALQGHIPSRQFDPAIERFILWGAIWKTRGDAAPPGLGAMVEAHVIRALNPFTVAGLGKSPHSIRMSRRHGDRTGQTGRFYILNDRLAGADLRLCEPRGAPAHTPCAQGTDRFVPLSPADFAGAEGSAFAKIPPYKSRLYYINRYFRHPVYEYRCAAIQGADADIKAVFFWRFCSHAGARCIRIVDYMGDGRELAGSLHRFRRLLYDAGAEFIDFIQYGIPKESLLAGGFVDLADTRAVLAHYFEPFLLQNVVLDFNFKSKDPALPPMIFKGDADQDRPNILL